MCTDLWIIVSNFVVGAGTIFLAVMALRSIHQTNALQKKEKLRRELYEISQWAIDITVIPSQVSFDIRLHEENMRRQGASDLWSKYNMLTSRIERIKILSIGFKEDKLDRIVTLVIHKLTKLMDLLKKRAVGQGSDETVKSSGDLLHKCSDALLKVITKVERRVVG